MHNGGLTADVAIISYKPLSGLNFAGIHCNRTDWSYMPSSPLGSNKNFNTANPNLLPFAHIMFVSDTQLIEH